jgi:hypothetical protein
MRHRSQETFCILLQFQNVVGLTLFAVQLSLFAIYPSTPKEKEKKRK